MKKLMMFGLIALQGCASIVNGRKQSVGISSNPSGASVNVTAVFESAYDETLKKKSDPHEVWEPTCVTPCFLNLRRNINYSVNLNKPGYEIASVSIYHKPSGWLWGDIFFGGLIGLAVDTASGGGSKLKPENVEAALQKK